MKKNRNVGIIGVGQSVYSSHREDVNQPELIHEAVVAALDDAGITMDDVDCVVHGNMELFEMVHQPDCWHVLGTGAYGKEAFRVTTGGTTGTTVACAADNLVASGLHDVVLAIGFEKLQEGHTTGGITNMADPLWGRQLQTGALTGIAAQDLIEEFGEERAKKVAMQYRIIMDQHAMLNKYAHRRFGLEFDQAAELAETSPPLVGELRMIHMCSQSDGACAIIVASEDKVKAWGKNAAWIRDHITVHREETFTIWGGDKEVGTMRYAAEKLFARNGITDPRKEIDVFEMYDPSAWWGVEWIKEFLLLEGDEHLKMIENGEISRDGSLPINPSGGVIASNPIGATALVRVAEAANQVRGTAGKHQLKKEIKQALASGFGGTLWSVLFLLTKEITW
ncbi:thiolase family protein [candidate division CSSED10-310 bacterium]|uniref:Thiolase family protein n=1 Tax=candidate division CSSED10-310 bacterium TaxID=2855610 RepID=A0ABV6YZJ7_UNCC1